VRKIEWTGMASIFADPRVQYLRMTGKVTPQMMQIYRNAAQMRVYRVTGRSKRILCPPDPFGLSRCYEWGPERASYIQEVEDGDWRIIQESTARAEFRDVTDGIPEVVIKPPQDIQYVREDHFHDLKSFLSAVKAGK
jgi:hypothetical protein